jgi:hypothetical protein
MLDVAIVFRLNCDQSIEVSAPENSELLGKSANFLISNPLSEV